MAHPVKSKLISLDENGFSLEVEAKNSAFSSVKKSVNVHKFTYDELQQSPVESMRRVVTKYSFPSWPAGGVHSIALWLIIAICAFDLGVLENKVYWIKHFALKVFQTQHVALLSLYAMAGLHFVETLYALYILSPIIKSRHAMFGWAVVNVIFGYPSTIRAMKLSALSKRKNKKAE